MTVYKYSFIISDGVTLMLPQGAELLHVAQQHDLHELCVWARVDPSRPKVPRCINVRGTGHPDADGIYVGTVILRGGAIVLHVFDAGEART